MEERGRVRISARAERLKSVGVTMAGMTGAGEGDDANLDAMLVHSATLGDEGALGRLFDQYRPRLRRMVAWRMDPQLQGRIDPSDVLQEAYLDLAKRLPEFGPERQMSIYVWLRLVTIERLFALRRTHIGALKRDARREVSLTGGADSSLGHRFADELIDHLSSVEHKLIRDEERHRMRELIAELDEVDREVIMMRVFEELSNGETAEALGLSKQAASRRFINAVRRLREQMQTITEVPGRE